ncbi:MAG: hypothetical protein C5B58_02915 [Acidobacteria bacterium]|nr:MAG: hypothetical protein C5B58_02915 [Acidobacteriota bacterium]
MLALLSALRHQVVRRSVVVPVAPISPVVPVVPVIPGSIIPIVPLERLGTVNIGYFSRHKRTLNSFNPGL